VTASGWRPRLIATDLDGTLLGPDRAVSPTNLAAARRAAEHGIPFVVATGRPVRWLDVLDELVLAHSQVIVSNGAAVFDLPTRTISRSFPVDPVEVLAVAADLRAAIPGISFGLETPTGFGCEPECPSHGRDLAGSVVGSLPELAATIGPVIKLLGYHAAFDSDALSARARPVVAGRLTLTHSFVGTRYGLIEISAPGVTKASTLALLCADLGIAADEVAAFGDMPNDLPMLAWAGRGFVVASGHPSLLAAGYTVVPGNDEDGVGRSVLALLAGEPTPSPYVH
jgi:hydroxymethylpyrimidine pyrophosphatase-like HAD family hydrolase